MEVLPIPADLAMISFDETSKTLSIFSSKLYDNGDYLSGTFIPDSFTVTIRALTDDDQDTGEFISI